MMKKLRVNRRLSISLLLGLSVVFAGLSLLFAEAVGSFALTSFLALLSAVLLKNKESPGARKALSDDLNIYRESFNNILEAVVVTNGNREVIAVNPAFTKMFGFQASEVLGKNPKTWASGLHDGRFYEDLYDLLRQTGEWRGEMVNKAKDGRELVCAQTIRAMKGKGSYEHPDYYVSVITDITDQKQVQEELQQLANYDVLTGLSNRRMFEGQVHQAISRAKRYQHAVAILFIDLDRFKGINDTLGHKAGDKLLTIVADRLSSLVRDADTVARLGGDEFVILVDPVETEAGIQALGRRVVEGVSQPIVIEHQEVYVGASVGYAIYPDHVGSAEHLIQAADMAMYTGKHSGRGQVLAYQDDMMNLWSGRVRLEGPLRNAMKRQELSIAYQPIKPLYGGERFSLEALMRWTNPELGEVSPSDFIPIAEESSLIFSMFQWMIDEVIRDGLELKREGYPLERISVNVTGIQFEKLSVRKEILAALERHQAPAELLCIEITEALLMSPSSQVLEEIKALRALGIRIVLDDFGTGYSSLVHLRHLPLDLVKIDPAFLTNLDDPVITKKELSIMRAVVELAHGLGLEVVAEGVECIRHLQMLATVGCDRVQGYFIGKPMTLQALKDVSRHPEE